MPRVSEIKRYKQPFLGSDPRHTHRLLFLCFCHLPTLITDILAGCSLYLEALGAVFSFKLHAVFFTVCTPEPGNNLNKCPSVLDHQCTERNYINSCKRTITLSGPNSLGSCFHLPQSLSAGYMFASYCYRFAPKLLFNTCCSL